MPKAYSYIRFSTAQQAKGDSLRRQLEKAREWCAEHKIELDDTLRDLGRSAYRGDNVQFGALGSFITLVREGKIEKGSYLLVESLDRLSRDTVIDAAMQLFELMKHGVHVVTLNDKQEYSYERLKTDWSPLIISVAVMARAHEESRTKGERVGEAWQKKRAAAIETGQAMTTIAPAWVRLVGGPRRGRYELDEGRAAIVRRIFDDTISGLGRRTIAKKLNAEGVEPWGRGKRKGQRWHDSYIQKIIGNPAAIGRFEPLGKRAGGDGSGGIVLEGYYPAVVDEQTYYAAQVAASARSMGQGRPSETHRNLLRGLAKCHACGSNLVLVDKGQRSSGLKLTCGKAHASAGCDQRTYYPYDPLETYILGAISDQIGRVVLSAQDRNASIRGDRNVLVAKRADIQTRMANLIDLVAATGGAASVASQVRTLQSEIEAITIGIDALEIEIRKTDASAGADTLERFRQLRSQLRDSEGDELVRARAAISQRLAAVVSSIEVGKDHAHLHLADGGEAHVYGSLT